MIKGEQDAVVFLVLTSKDPFIGAEALEVGKGSGKAGGALCEGGGMVDGIKFEGS